MHPGTHFIHSILFINILTLKTPSTINYFLALINAYLFRKEKKKSEILWVYQKSCFVHAKGSKIHL